MKHGKELPVAIPDISNSRVCVHICVFMFGESNKKKKKALYLSYIEGPLVSRLVVAPHFPSFSLSLSPLLDQHH